MNLHERVGTEQRVTAANLLSQALAGGYLELAEYERRVVAAQSAVTVGDIAAQMNDLPVQYRWQPVPVSPTGHVEVPQPPVDRRPMALVSIVLGALSIPTAFCLGIGALLGVAAVLTGWPALRSRDSTMAVWGLVLGALSVVIALTFLVALLLPNPDGTH